MDIETNKHSFLFGNIGGAKNGRQCVFSASVVSLKWFLNESKNLLWSNSPFNVLNKEPKIWKIVTKNDWFHEIKSSLKDYSVIWRKNWHPGKYYTPKINTFPGDRPPGKVLHT